MIPDEIVWNLLFEAGAALAVIAVATIVLVRGINFALSRTRRRDPEDDAPYHPTGNFAHPFHDVNLSERQSARHWKPGGLFR